jgi:hypothetical protein
VSGYLSTEVSAKRLRALKEAAERAPFLTPLTTEALNRAMFSPKRDTRANGLAVALRPWLLNHGYPLAGFAPQTLAQFFLEHKALKAGMPDFSNTNNKDYRWSRYRFDRLVDSVIQAAEKLNPAHRSSEGQHPYALLRTASDGKTRGNYSIVNLQARALQLAQTEPQRRLLQESSFNKRIGDMVGRVGGVVNLPKTAQLQIDNVLSTFDKTTKDSAANLLAMVSAAAPLPKRTCVCCKERKDVLEFDVINAHGDYSSACSTCVLRGEKEAAA